MMDNNEISREVLLELSPSSSLPSSTSIPNYSSQSVGARRIRSRRRRSVMYNSNKTKSRLVEPSYPRSKLKVSDDQDFENFTVTATLGSSLSSSDGDDDDDDADDDEVYVTSSRGGRDDEEEKKLGNKNVIIKLLTLMEWITLFCMVCILISSLCINKLKNRYIWGLNIWKWCILILVVFCGDLVTKWFMDLLEFFIGKNFLFKKKVLYFIYGVKGSVRVFLWLGLILLTWILLTTNKRSSSSSSSSRRALNYISRGIGCSLLGAVLWMVKDFLIKLLASSFHVKTFFDRIQDSIFHQYVLQLLSSSASSSLHRSNAINNHDNDHKGMLRIKKSNQKKKKSSSGEEDEVIRVDKLNKVKKEKVSAWTMGGLMKTISSSGLSVTSELLEEDNNGGGGVVAHKEIRTEFDAKLVAKHIFKKVAKTSNEYIEEQDLLQFMSEDEVDRLLMMFDEAAETGKIKKTDFKSWVVKVYQERKHLKYSLNDSKTAIEELNKIITTCLIVIIIIAWLLLMRIITTRVLLFISSQLLLVAFVFGNSAKTLFECLIFVFVTHPFDVGDKCVIDGVQMTVEEMNILSTSFLRYDNEMIYYPNSVLAKKPIANFNRSPEMADSVEFSVDFSTSVQSIAALKARIKRYLESKPKYWRAGHSVTITAIEDMNKLKMLLRVTHTVNFQSPERVYRRSELLLELKTIFEDLEIKYRLLPQELQVHLTNNPSSSTSSSSSS